MLVPDRDHDLRLARAQAAAAESPPLPKPATRAAMPPWVPEGVAYDMLSERARTMIAEIVEPAYEQLVLRARDALEKTTGLTIVHLVWQEILDQIDLARDYEHVDSVLNIVTPAREDLLQRHLQLIYAKLKAANYLMRVRDFRRGLARALREAKAKRLKAPNPGPSGDATPPDKLA